MYMSMSYYYVKECDSVKRLTVSALRLETDRIMHCLLTLQTLSVSQMEIKP